MHSSIRSIVSVRVRAAFGIALGGMFLLGTVLSGTALADPSNANSTSQTVDAIGAHTHQLHGTVKTAPSSGSTSFVVTTERYGDVTVSFVGSSGRGQGHGRGNARAFEVGNASDLTAGERVIVLGNTSTDGKTFLARRVHVLPAAGAGAGGSHTSHLVGSIASVSTSTGTTTITLKLADGSTSQAVKVTADTRIRPGDKSVADLTVGTRVTMVEKDGNVTGVVIMPA
jgi:hypothetical protein